MLGYDLQTSTVTQRPVAGPENPVMYIWLYKSQEVSFPLVQLITPNPVV